MARVLIADDDEDIRLLIQMRLRRDGHEVTAFPDGQSAYDALAATPDAFDLAILDNSMPGLTGLEVIERCRAEARLADLRILMVTAFVQEQDVAEGLRIGADHYMAKPFQLQELADQVTRLLA